MTGCSGEGVITQQRTCTQPFPSCGGRECLGENIVYVSCTCSPGTYIVTWPCTLYIRITK